MANKVTIDFDVDHVKDVTFKPMVLVMLAAFAVSYLPSIFGHWFHLPAVEHFGDTVLNAGMLTAAGEWTQPWRLVTSMFLHGGFLHIGLNLLALWFFWMTVRTDFPKYTWVVIFFVAGLVGGVAQMAWSSESCLGASGGIMGLWGAAFAASLRYRTLPVDERPWQHVLSISWMLWNIGLQMGLEFFIIGHVGHGAHIGGFFAGAALGLVLPLVEQPAVLVSRFEAFRLVDVTTAIGPEETETVKEGLKSLKQKMRRVHIIGLQFETTGDFNADSDYMVVASKTTWFGKETYTYHEAPVGSHLHFHPGLGEKRAATSSKIGPAYADQTKTLGKDHMHMVTVKSY